MLQTDYQKFIHLSRYARWDEEKGRRETWEETVDRYVNYFSSKFEDFPKDVIREAILNIEVMPSMRCLMTAGEALERENVAGYNCAYVAVDYVEAFDESMYILLNGTGVGFSVERQYISKLPKLPRSFEKRPDLVIKVADSKEGWAKAYRQLINCLYAGEIPSFDVSEVRPAGAILRTFGGRASGPGPLVKLFDQTIGVFTRAEGVRLSSIECHDLMCYIASAIVVGGVRRSALLSLSNLSDLRMREAKKGDWYTQNPQRALANNSVAYTEKPDDGTFMEEWLSLYKSRSGERGIFSREAASKSIPVRRKKYLAGIYDEDSELFPLGCNPCSEILLQSNQFCNLTEVIIRAEDTKDTIAEKVGIATLLGTYQAALTDYQYLNSRWKENSVGEALLGVSMTGICDNEFMSTPSRELAAFLNELQHIARDVNYMEAVKIGINPATAITCIKPSGTVSQLTNTASGIHSRYSPYYIRSVRGDMKDPLTKFMQDKGVPWEPDIHNPESTAVFYFPEKAPEGAICTKEVSAIEQLELWKTYQLYWCEHKPSVTISVRKNEWMRVGAWVFDNFDYMSGVSFLPYDDHVYQQAPYAECSQGEYTTRLASMPTDIDWTELGKYEKEDNTTSSQELACVGGACEIK